MVKPEFTGKAIRADCVGMQQMWGDRQAAFARFDNLAASLDTNKEAGLESMVANNAKTLLSLAHFMVATGMPQRTVAVGAQDATARMRAGKAERAVAAWWDAVDQERTWAGLESWQSDMAYWMCLYGWYATMALTVEQDGEPVFVAVPYNPAECFGRTTSRGLVSFARIYSTSLAEALQRAEESEVSLPLSGRANLGAAVTLYDWWYLQDKVYNAVLVEGGGVVGQAFVKEPDEVRGLDRIPVFFGPVGGTPSRTGAWQSNPGSVLAENERVYADFNKWLSFLTQLTKEYARTPLVARGIHLEEEQISPEDLRSGRAIIETDDPAASIERVDVGAAPVDVFRLLSIISSQEQRGGFPEASYGNLAFEMSGFGISQLIQAAERRVGAQIRRLAALDSVISQRWLRDYQSGGFGEVTIAGFEGGNPRRSFIEQFGPRDVPEKFRVSVNIPLRLGNDLMSRMAIVRQAVGNVQILDLYTALDEILQMQDPSLIMQRIGEDRARTLAEPLTMAMNLKAQAAEIRARGDKGSAEAAQALEQFAATLLEQQQQQAGPQARQRIAPEVLPPEAQGRSPDQVRAAMRLGPAPNQGGL